LGNKKNNH